MRFRIGRVFCALLLFVSIPVLAQDSKNVTDVLKEAGNCSTFLKILQVGGMDAPSKPTDTFTIFAPTDDAIKKMNPADLKKLTGDASQARQFVWCHQTFWKETTAELEKAIGSKLTMMSGGSQPISKQGSTFMIGSARIVKLDLHAIGTTIHLIDNVLCQPQ